MKRLINCITNLEYLDKCLKNTDEETAKIFMKSTLYKNVKDSVIKYRRLAMLSNRKNRRMINGK